MLSDYFLPAKAPAGSDASDSPVLSLDEIARSLLGGVTSGIQKGVSDRIGGNSGGLSAPTPDVASQAVTPGAKTFTDTKVMGIALPILLVGVAATVYLIAKR